MISRHAAFCYKVFALLYTNRIGIRAMHIVTFRHEAEYLYFRRPSFPDGMLGKEPDIFSTPHLFGPLTKTKRYG